MTHQPLWLCNAKDILVEEQLHYYLNSTRGDKEVHILPKDICPKSKCNSITGVWTCLVCGHNPTLQSLCHGDFPSTASAFYSVYFSMLCKTWSVWSLTLYHLSIVCWQKNPYKTHIFKYELNNLSMSWNFVLAFYKKSKTKPPGKLGVGGLLFYCHLSLN